MRILITGGAGFQGSHITNLLTQAGHRVTILNTPSPEAERNIASFAKDVPIVWGSVTDKEIVTKAVRGMDVVLHLAAQINVDESIHAPVTFIEVNTLGTCNVLAAVRNSGCRLIYASTCEVYGYSGDAPLKESAELKPYSPYAASKAGAERLCYAYYMTYGVDVTIVRPCNIYGEGQKRGKGGAVISIFANRALKGEPLVVSGNGQQRREYMHVSDLTQAYALILGREDLKGTSINIGTGETVSIKEIAEAVSAKFDVPIEFQPARLGEVPGFRLDSSFANSLGFTPRVKFWDGLERYIAWVKASASSQEN